MRALELVALNTHALEPARAGGYLDRLNRGLRAARMSKSFPDRGTLARLLELMKLGLQHAQYAELLVDARSGLPNMASFTRVATDAEVAREHGLGFGEDKRAYREGILAAEVPRFEVANAALRRFDAKKGVSEVRIDLTKLDASGAWIRVTVELSQAGRGGRVGIELDVDDKTAAARDDLHATIYRHAAFDAETLFVRLQELPGVEVERVERGVVGPACVQFGDGLRLPAQLEGRLAVGWSSFPLRPEASAPDELEMMLSFQSDIAARDLREERSNDPLVPLLRDRVQDGERARYEATRERLGFKVFKDRKFVATRALMPLAKVFSEAAGTKNLVYPLR